VNKRNMWLGIGALVIVVVVIFALVHKSDNKKTPLSSSTATTSSTSKSPSSSSKQTAAQIVTTQNNTSDGQYLADGNSKPLYTYSADTTGVSNCTGSCLDDWPLYGPVSTPASLPTNVTIISRSDGKAQYAYKGMPLYYFSGDSSSTPTGDGVGGFNIAKP